MIFLEIKKFLDVSNQSKNTDLHLKAVFSCTKKLKFLVIHLTKAKYLYSKNYKTLMEEIEEDPNKWKDIPCS